MKTWNCAGAFIAVALTGGGCAPLEGGEVRARPTTPAYGHYSPSQSELDRRVDRSARGESPLAHACNTGSSKACNDVGDRLVLKHVYAEARRWYGTSCERVLDSMVPTATHLMQLSRDAKRLESSFSHDDEVNGANQRQLAEVKKDASEIRARIQGCFDAGETLKFEHELKQALKYYDSVCEFSALADAIGEALPGFQHVIESGCTAGQSVRTELTSKTPFSPQLFVGLAQQRQPAPAKGAPPSDQGMVFTEGDL
jgi:hypothetical protein